MSILSDKYKIPEPTIKNMMGDGVIATSWNTWEKVKHLRSLGKSTKVIADTLDISDSYVQKLLRRTI